MCAAILHRCRRLAMVLVAATACSADGPASTPSPAQPTPPAPTDPPAAEVSVAIVTTDDGYGGVAWAFSPTAVAVATGGSVTWRNESGVLHDVTFGGETNPVGVGGEHERVFPTAGSFPYSCTLHAGMQGSVLVIDDD